MVPTTPIHLPLPLSILDLPPLGESEKAPLISPPTTATSDAELKVPEDRTQRLAAQAHIASLKTTNETGWRRFLKENTILGTLISLVYSVVVKCLLLPALRLNKKNLDQARQSFTTIPSNQLAKIQKETSAQIRSLYNDIDVTAANRRAAANIPLLGTLLDDAKEVDAGLIKQLNAHLNITLTDAEIEQLEKTQAKAFVNMPKYMEVDRPSLATTLEKILLDRRIAEWTTSPLAPAFVNIETHDKVRLDCCEMRSPQQISEPLSRQKWIIRLNGNNEAYENCQAKLEALVDDHGANVLTGNYRGVGRSQGMTTGSHDEVSDAEAMAQHLLTQGVLPENIIIDGYSLGGGPAAQVASMHPGMHLCLDRTFTRHSEAADAVVTDTLNQPTIADTTGNRATRIYNRIKQAFVIAMKALGRALNAGALARRVVAAGWELDTLGALEKMAKTSTGRVTILEHTKDDIIIGRARVGASIEGARNAAMEARQKEARGPWVQVIKLSRTVEGHSPHELTLLHAFAGDSMSIKAVYQKRFRDIFAGAVAA